MTSSTHPFTASLSSPGASTSARPTRHDEEDVSDPESLSFPYSYDVSEFETARSSSPKPGSRSSSGPTRPSKRPAPSLSSDRRSPIVKLHKARAASSAKLKPSSSQPPRSKFKSHPDHPNTEEILHMIDPHFYSSLTPSASSTPPSASRLGDEEYDPYSTHPRYNASSSHTPDLSRPYTDAEGRLHDPAFRTFDVELAPHARRARASRSSLVTQVGAVSGGILPRHDPEYRPARSHSAMMSSDSGKRPKVSGQTLDFGVPASLDPLIGPAGHSPASWDYAEVGFGSLEYDSEPGMDPRDAVIVTARGPYATDSGFASANSRHSPPEHLIAGHSPGSGTTASSSGPKEGFQIQKGPSTLSAATKPQFVDDRAPYSPYRASSSPLVPPDQGMSSRRNSPATAPDGSGSGARTPQRPTVVRKLSRNTLYPRPVVDNPFPSHITASRTASQGIPRLIAPPLSPPTSTSSQSDGEYIARRRSTKKGRRSPIMGMPEGYLDDEDSPFKPVIVQPIEPEKPPPRGVVPTLFVSYHPASPAHDSRRRSAKGPEATESMAAAARRNGEREGHKKELRHRHESDQDRRRKTKPGSRTKSSWSEGASSEKAGTDPHSLRAQPPKVSHSYALQQEPQSFAGEVGGFLRTEKPRIGVALSSVGPAERDGSREARTSMRNQYVPSQHGKSISIRPGVDVIHDDYT